MKRQIAKRSNCVMQYFTPELYVRYNSKDDVIADEAEHAWEAAIAEYGVHLKKLRGSMPEPVRALSELSLHDYEILGSTEQMDTNGNETHGGLAVLSLKNRGRLTNLIYSVCASVRRNAPNRNWPFSKERKHWLYDELDAGTERPGTFIHRILFSDGSMLEISFTTTVIQFARSPKTAAM